jgi:NADH-quinone oxidoreductase subunit N
MLENLQHIIASTRRFAIDEYFVLALLSVIIIVTFNPDLSNSSKHPRFTWLLIGVLGGFWFLYGKQLSDGEEVKLFYDSIIIDDKAVFFKRLILVTGIITLLHHRFFDYKIEGEFFIFLFGAMFGLFLVVMTTHLLVLFVALEFVSICSYLLVVMKKGKLNVESGIKYLLFGATSSAIMLYGMSWFYGLTGSLNFADPAFNAALLETPAWIVQVVGFMTLGGVFFKLSAAPFHAWTPDIYEATPTPIASFLSIAPKAAAVLLMTRIFENLSIDFVPMLTVVILLSLTIGNFSALWQTNAKRMLGYSTIAQAGFILIGLLVGNTTGFQATFFYVTAYVCITMGAFVLVDLIAQRTLNYELESMQGLGQFDAIISVVAVVLMMGLVGFPPTIGFTSKLLVFSSLWDVYQFDGNAIYAIVLVFGLLNTAVSMVYYLKIPFYLIVKPRPQKTTWLYAGLLKYVLAVMLAFVAVYLFVFPENIINLVNGFEFR